MEIIREYREIDSDEIVIKIPRSFKTREVEVLVLPINNPTEKTPTRKKIQLTTFKWNGKKREFSRADAYDDM